MVGSAPITTPVDITSLLFRCVGPPFEGWFGFLFSPFLFFSPLRFLWLTDRGPTSRDSKKETNNQQKAAAQQASTERSTGGRGDTIGTTETDAYARESRQLRFNLPLKLREFQQIQKGSSAVWL